MTETHQDLLAKLRAPFPATDVKWRIQSAGASNSNPWAIVVPYITNRAIQQRLDDTFGFDWENVQKETASGNGFLCGLSVIIDGRTITRWDGAECTHIEPLKGGLSDAMKRAGVQFGIGRYLYQMDSFFADCKIFSSRYEAREDGFKYQWMKPGQRDKWEAFGMGWKEPELPAWALPSAVLQPFLDAIKNAETLDELRRAWQPAYLFANTSGDENIMGNLEEEKEKCKAAIEKKLIDNREANLNKVSLWLDSQIKVMGSIPNKSSLTALYKAIQLDLVKRCEGGYFDDSELKDRLKISLINCNKALDDKKTKKGQQT